jgi:hypothetical protein
MTLTWATRGRKREPTSAQPSADRHETEDTHKYLVSALRIEGCPTSQRPRRFEAESATLAIVVCWEPEEASGARRKSGLTYLEAEQTNRSAAAGRILLLSMRGRLTRRCDPPHARSLPGLPVGSRQRGQRTCPHGDSVWKKRVRCSPRNSIREWTGGGEHLRPHGKSMEAWTATSGPGTTGPATSS